MCTANSLLNTAFNEIYTSAWEDNHGSWSFCELLTGIYIINFPGSNMKFDNPFVILKKLQIVFEVVLKEHVGW